MSILILLSVMPVNGDDVPACAPTVYVFESYEKTVEILRLYQQPRL